MIKLRGHHTLCLLSFEGKGYSQDFVVHMNHVLHSLDEIQIISECDEICRYCPHKKGKTCEYEWVKEYDQRLIEAMGFEKEKNYSWQEIKPELEKINLKDICCDCQWFSICKKRLVKTNP